MTSRRSFVFLSGSSLLCNALKANWPQWRGPNSNGATTTAKGLPVSWDETTNVLWRTKLPSWSAATPIIWENTIFIVSAEEHSVRLGEVPKGAANPNKLFLLAIHRQDGSIRWRKHIDTGNQIYRKQNASSPSPITDGKNVWLMTGNGLFLCMSMEGDVVWKRNIPAEYGRFGLNHGYGSSPLLHEGRLYVEVLHGMKTDDPSYLFAVDSTTGKTIWKVERPTDAVRESPDNYSTPQMAFVNGKPELIIGGGDYLTGHDIHTGKELWRLGGFNPEDDPTNRTISSALVIGDLVFFNANRGKPYIGVRAGGSGNVTGKREIWTNDLGADVPTPTTDGRYIYVLADNGTMNCLEAATGKVMYRKRRIELGTYSSSPLLADGKIYCTNEEGVTTILKAGPEFAVLGVGKLDGYTLSSPVAVDNQVFIRTAEYLYCIQNR